MNPIYNNWGLYATGLLIEGAMLATLIILILIYRHLVPLETIIAREKKKEALAAEEKAV